MFTVYRRSGTLVGLTNSQGFLSKWFFGVLAGRGFEGCKHRRCHVTCRVMHTSGDGCMVVYVSTEEREGSVVSVLPQGRSSLEPRADMVVNWVQKSNIVVISVDVLEARCGRNM